jgi:hypothetical protein
MSESEIVASAMERAANELMDRFEAGGQSAAISLHDIVDILKDIAVIIRVEVR